MITILCSGSRGDIQPYIALARELIALGKEVCIVTGASFANFVTGYGIGFHPLSADLTTVQDLDPELLRQAQSSDNPLKMLMTFRKMKHFADRAAASITAECMTACAGSEIIVYHPGCAVGYFAAQQMGVPAVLATPFPLHRTRQRASLVAYGRYPLLPGPVSYTLLQGMLWSVSKNAIADYWRQTTGAVPENFGCPFERMSKRHPAVVSCSNAVFQRPADWNEHIHQSGYWFVHEADTYQPPPALADFLAAGEKPVYFGFGSVLGQNEGARVARIAAEALQITGKRGILCGFGDAADLPDSIFAIPSIPHSWLFARVAAICHHGGAGTAAAGFAAGRPSIIVPFSNDQFAWAHRAYELGVAPEPFTIKQLTAERLAAAIRFTDREDVRRKANTLGDAVRAENGARDAALVILAAQDAPG